MVSGCPVLSYSVRRVWDDCVDEGGFDEPGAAIVVRNKKWSAVGMSIIWPSSKRIENGWKGRALTAVFISSGVIVASSFVVALRLGQAFERSATAGLGWLSLAHLCLTHAA